MTEGPAGDRSMAEGAGAGEGPADSVEQVLVARNRPIDGFDVARLLPAPERRMVGPFIFFDHFGPDRLAPGQGMDVRPHPHINLATVTYLFQGAMLHRDSLGCQQRITPGAINWMTAGRGIVHSERTPPDTRAAGSDQHGLQLWVALPRAAEESDPSFMHYPAEALPAQELEGVGLRVLVGSAFGLTSPVRVLSPTIYLELRLSPGARLEIPAEHEQRGLYVVDGAVTCAGLRAQRRQMLVFRSGLRPVLHSEAGAHVMMIGGAALDGPRHIWWNFVSSSKERIEQAKADWQAMRIGTIPGDDREFIPLPAA
jgi:redox-sensitive bicupin YhaK (pirin superfamily)